MPNAGRNGMHTSKFKSKSSSCFPKTNGYSIDKPCSCKTNTVRNVHIAQFWHVTWSYLIINKRQGLWKRVVNTKYILLLSLTFVWNISYSNKYSVNYASGVCRNTCRSSCKGPVIIVQFCPKLEHVNTSDKTSHYQSSRQYILQFLS
jgi:hypothetical protein